MNQPNPQKQYRNRLIEAMRAQQAEITGLKQTNATLVSAVTDLVNAAGVGKHPRFASLRALAGTPDEAPATTTEQARKPDATDDPTSSGSVPAPANAGVTPDATTDVQTTDVALPEDKPLDNLQDVTAPVAGTDAVDPAAVFNGDVQVGKGSDTSMSQTPSGWTGTPGSTGRSASKDEDAIERFTASVRLARLQIEAGLATGEDMMVAEAISKGDQSLGEINAVAATLQQVKTAKSATRQPSTEHRRLVPQAAPRQAGITPSMQQAPALGGGVTASRAGDDEWGLGYTD